MNRYECILLLFDYGADVNIADRSYSTPLHIACTLELPELIPLLLSKHCDISAFDIEGKTAENIADEGNSEASFTCSVLIRRYAQSHSYQTEPHFNQEEDGLEGDSNFYSGHQHSPESHSRKNRSHAPQQRLVHSKSTPKPFLAGSMRFEEPMMPAGENGRGSSASPPPRFAPSDNEKMRLSNSTSKLPKRRPSHSSLVSSRYVDDTALMVDTVPSDRDDRYDADRPATTGRRHFSTTRRHDPEQLPFLAGSNKMTKEREAKTLYAIYSPPAPLREKTSIFPYAPFTPPHKDPQKNKSASGKIRIAEGRTPKEKNSEDKNAVDTQKFHWVPFQPQVARFLDVIISVEQCTDCHLHNFSSWHNADHYVKAADACLHAVIKAISMKYTRLRVFAYKVKNQCSYKASQRIGSLEVVMTIKTSANDNTKWSSKTLHSKLATLRHVAFTCIIYFALLMVFIITCN